MSYSRLLNDALALFYTGSQMSSGSSSSLLPFPLAGTTPDTSQPENFSSSTIHDLFNEHILGCQATPIGGMSIASQPHNYEPLSSKAKVSHSASSSRNVGKQSQTCPELLDFLAVRGPTKRRQKRTRAEMAATIRKSGHSNDPSPSSPNLQVITYQRRHTFVQTTTSSTIPPAPSRLPPKANFRAGIQLPNYTLCVSATGRPRKPRQSCTKLSDFVSVPGPTARRQKRTRTEMAAARSNSKCPPVPCSLPGSRPSTLSERSSTQIQSEIRPVPYRRPPPPKLRQTHSKSQADHYIRPHSRLSTALKVVELVSYIRKHDMRRPAFSSAQLPVVDTFLSNGSRAINEVWPKTMKKIYINEPSTSMQLVRQNLTLAG